MKIDLSSEATEAVKSLRDKLGSSYSAINTRHSAIVSALVMEFAKTLHERDLAALSSQLITQAGRRRTLIKRLMELDEDALSKIENSVKKFRQTNLKNDENIAKNAQISTKLS
jgi:hypothetical protein